MSYPFLQPWITDEKIHKKKDGCELITEDQLVIIYDVIKAATPARGHKSKHKEAIKILENLFITMHWHREEEDAQNFLKEYRLKKLTEVNQ
jgi:hypothetical protein